ncbi:MAG: amidohydrolase family protein [Gammaproteobacteria bacterium]
MTGHGVDARVIRARLKHPVIDADGHTVEYVPALESYIQAEGVTIGLNNSFAAAIRPLAQALERNKAAAPHGFEWYRRTPEERYRRRITRPSWWGVPAENTLDLATAMFPHLLAQRLESLGIDFAVVYPTMGLGFPHVQTEQVRLAACRAINRYHADIFAGHRQRLEPVAVIPMHTPAEALNELEYAVRTLGYRAILIPSYVQRPIPAAQQESARMAGYATALDTYGIDSAYDYDPVWAKCIELGVSVSTHSPTMGIGTRASISSYMYNHIGHFAAAGEALCKSLFFGGVTRRFPRLRVALLEGGVAWGATVYGDIVSRWSKRNRDSVRRYAPERIDLDRFTRLFLEHADAAMRSDLGNEVSFALEQRPQNENDFVDEWAASGVNSVQDIHDRFVPNFFFGCEADDRMVAASIDPRLFPLSPRFRAFFSSDIGHWDVPDMRGVLPEAWELVQDGLLDEEGFADFTFRNAARFYLESNPHFFDGTALAQEVKGLQAA